MLAVHWRFITEIEEPGLCSLIYFTNELNRLEDNLEIMVKWVAASYRRPDFNKIWDFYVAGQWRMIALM